MILIQIDDKDSNDEEVIAEEGKYPVIEHYGRYSTRDSKQVNRLIPTRSVRTHDSRYIHLNIELI